MCLCEFLDEAQFEIRNDQEDGDHDDQSQMILPQTPGRKINALIVQKLISCRTSEMIRKHITSAHSDLHLEREETVLYVHFYRPRARHVPHVTEHQSFKLIDLQSL